MRVERKGPFADRDPVPRLCGTLCLAALDPPFAVHPTATSGQRDLDQLNSSPSSVSDGSDSQNAGNKCTTTDSRAGTAVEWSCDAVGKGAAPWDLRRRPLDKQRRKSPPPSRISHPRPAPTSASGVRLPASPPELSFFPATPTTTPTLLLAP